MSSTSVVRRRTTSIRLVRESRWSVVTVPTGHSPSCPALRRPRLETRPAKSQFNGAVQRWLSLQWSPQSVVPRVLLPPVWLPLLPSFQASNAGPRAAASAPYLVLPASLERYKTQVITKYCSSGPADASWVRRATDGRTAWQGSWTSRSPTYPLSLLVGSHNCQGNGSDGWGVRHARVNTSKRGRGHMDNL